MSAILLLHMIHFGAYIRQQYQLTLAVSGPAFQNYVEGQSGTIFAVISSFGRAGTEV
jgi:hypothetical protein